MIAAVGIGLLLLPRVPGIGAQVNGAYLGVHLGPISFQPAEFAKIAIVIFLASYLRDTRQLLVTARGASLGMTIPPLKHFGPLLVVWGAAMLMLFFIRDLGSSLMFFGGFLARALRRDQPAVVRGRRAGAVRARRVVPRTHVRPHITDRVDAWQHPFDPRSTTRSAAATRSPSRCSPRPTAGCSARASGRRCSQAAGGRRADPARRRTPTSSTR